MDNEITVLREELANKKEELKALADLRTKLKDFDEADKVTFTITAPDTYEVYVNPRNKRLVLRRNR